MTVAAIAWQIRPCTNLRAFVSHFEDVVAMVPAGALAVFPELVVLELLGLHPGVEEREVPRALAEYAELWEELLARAAASGIGVVGGSHICAEGSGYVNECLVLEGQSAWRQQKVKLTQWESQEWGLTAGAGLARVLPSGLGVSICYDSEFPEAGRALAEAGVTTLCVPSYTETVRGFQRVRWSCLARAVENQIFVVHSSLVGELGREPVPSTYGSSAVIAPSVPPFPEQAVLAETALGEEGVAIAELDFGALEEARGSGDVRNWHDRDPSVWTFLD